MKNIYTEYKSIKAHFIDEIPAHWHLSRVKYLAKIDTSGIWGIDEGKEDMVLVKIPTTAQITSEGKWVIDSMKELYVTNEERDYYTCEEGDIIVVKASGSSDNIITGKAGYISKEEQRLFAFGNFLLRVRAIEFSSKFLYYFLTSNITKQRIEKMVASTTYPNLKVNEYINAIVPIPSATEQTIIAQYLDYQTGIIDQLIKKKEKLIELLKEKRQSIINEAVTKGLNPKAKMKDSGIEWLGEVPEHWKVVRIGHYTQLIRGASPRPAGDPLYFGGDYMPWITVGEVTNGDDKYVLCTENYLTKEGSEQSRVIYPETLLLSNSGATLGVPKISKIKGCINDGSVAFININQSLDRDFLFYFFKTHTDIYRQEMSGYGQPNLNTDIVKSTKCPLPPLEEQKQIIDFIESEFKEFDAILALSQKQIEKLKDYRQSLISEAVTGKIDVRDWQPNKK